MSNNKKTEAIKPIKEKKGVRYSPVQAKDPGKEKKKEQNRNAKLLGDGLAGKAAEGMINRRLRDEELLNSL